MINSSFHRIVKTSLVIFFLAFAFFVNFSTATDKEKSIATLRKEYSKAKEDTTKVQIVCKLAQLYLDKMHWDSSLYFCQQAIELLEGKPNNEELIAVYYWQGNGYYRKGNIDKALVSYLKALEIAKKLNNKRQSEILNDIAVLYKSQGDYLKAIDYFQKNLEYNENNKDSLMIGRTLNNMANVYFSYGIYKKSLEYYLKGIEIFKKLGKENYVGFLLINVALTYKKLGDYKKALETLRQSQDLFIKLNFKPGLAQANGEIGAFYAEQGKYELALKYQEEALKLYETLGEKMLIAITYKQIGEIYQKAGSYITALSYFQKSVTIFKELNAKKELLDSYENIATIHSLLGNYKLAYDYFKIYSNLKDSVLGEDYLRQMQEFEAKYESEKKENEIKLQKAELAKKESEAKRKNIFMIAIAMIALMVIGFSVIIFKQYSEKKKANILLAEQNDQIKKQRDQIFQQKKEITDSIHYASRIQRAVLSSPKPLEENGIQYFILYKPRDIVSGDFYWINQKNNKILVAAADCTGHGVPGAFMSMLGMALLNEIITKGEVESAAQVLNELRSLVIKSLHQSGAAEETKDGMDMALCMIDDNLSKVQFAGAFYPLYLIRDNEIIEGAADRMPVGYHDRLITDFTNSEFTLQKNDIMYIFSDGYVDQFGGENGKKFMAKRFKQLLIDIHNEPMEKQKEILDTTITEWRGELDQVDDILVIGLRV